MKSKGDDGRLLVELRNLRAEYYCDDRQVYLLYCMLASTLLDLGETKGSAKGDPIKDKLEYSFLMWVFTQTLHQLNMNETHSNSQMTPCPGGPSWPGTLLPSSCSSAPPWGSLGGLQTASCKQPTRHLHGMTRFLNRPPLPERSKRRVGYQM